MQIVKYIALVFILCNAQLPAEAGIVPVCSKSQPPVQQTVIVSTDNSYRTIPVTEILQGRNPVKKIGAVRRKERVKEAFISTGAVIYAICEIIIEILIDSNCHSYH